jgi:hypothetical protein
MPTIIDALYEQNKEAIAIVSRADEVSIAADLDNKLKKHLIMAAASYFETEVRGCIEQLAVQASGNNIYIVSLIKQKAIERQYHTYFDWEKGNANRFFAHFGDEFKNRCKREVDNDAELACAMRAFVDLGDMRNKLAHLNFAQYPIDKTSDEIYAQYEKALVFLAYIKRRLLEAEHTDEPPVI